MDSPFSHQLFVYSSLRYGFHEGAFNYITQFFKFTSPGKVKGVLKDLGGLPVATQGSEDSFISGDLYTLNKDSDFAWAFAQLDDYEGLIAETGEQPLYRRELTTVYKDDGSTTDAWIYWYNIDVSGEPIVTAENLVEY